MAKGQNPLDVPACGLLATRVAIPPPVEHQTVIRFERLVSAPLSGLTACGFDRTGFAVGESTSLLRPRLFSQGVWAGREIARSANAICEKLTEICWPPGESPKNRWLGVSSQGH